MLIKQITYDHNITEDGCIQVRRITRIIEDGQEIAKTYHRHVVSPGDSSLDQDERTCKLVMAIHTPDVITKFELEIQKILEKMEGKSDEK